MRTSNLHRHSLISILIILLLSITYQAMGAGYETMDQASRDAFIAKIRPTYAVLVADRGTDINLGPFVVTIGKDEAQTWGLVIDKFGDVITAANNLFDMSRGYTVTGLSIDKTGKGEAPEKGTLKKIISKNINNDYVIVSSGLPESEIQLPILSNYSPAFGDALIIIQDPFADNPVVWECTVAGSRFDPFMGDLLEISAPKYIANRMALAYDQDGGLLGLVAGERLRGGHTVMIIPARNLGRFCTDDDLSLEDFSKQVAEKLKKEEEDSGNEKPFKEAQKLYWLGEYDSALAKMNAVLEMEPSHVQAQVYIAAIYHSLGQEDKYEENLLKAAEMDETIDEIYYLLANLYAERGDTDKAVDAYKEALDINGKNALALYELGKIYKDAGKKGKTKRIYYDLKDISPELAAELE